MGTYHEDWAIEALKTLDDKQRVDLGQIQILLLQRRWGDLQDVVFQDYRGWECSVEDALAWSQLWEGFSRGQILYIPVQVGETPLTDKNRAKNEKTLNGGLKRWKMKASVLRHNGDDDGRIDWSEPLVVDQAWFDPESSIERYRTYQIPAGWCRLEIGATKGSRTVFHLRGGRKSGVARWPYRSEMMWILLPAQSYLPEATLIADKLKDGSGRTTPIIGTGGERLIQDAELPSSLRDNKLNVPEYGLFGRSLWLKEFDELLEERLEKAGLKGWMAKARDKAPEKPTPPPDPEPEPEAPRPLLLIRPTELHTIFDADAVTARPPAKSS